MVKRVQPSNLKPVSVSPSVEPESQCKICKDTHWVYLDATPGEPGYGKAVRCQCQREKDRLERMAFHLRFCNLPANTEHMTLDNFKADSKSLRQALKLAKQIAAGGSMNWLTLLGKVDRGKTHLAVGVCRAWLERDVAARYVYVPILLNELRKGFDNADWNYSDRLSHFLNVPLLVLDDLGVQKPTPWAQEQLQTIIDYRFMEGLALIVTSNKPIDDIPGDDEHRIASRLQRNPNGAIAVIESGEFRLEGADCRKLKES